MEEEMEALNDTLGLWELTMDVTPLTFTPWLSQLVQKGVFLFKLQNDK